MSAGNPNFVRGSIDYYFYFSDKYMSLEEVSSKDIRNAGFYLIVNKKRLKFILPRYHKDVLIVSESPYGKSILNAVISHNNEISTD
jgi:hypothetical protein